MEYSIVHTSVKCLEGQLSNKNKIIEKLESNIDDIKEKLDFYEMTMEKIIKGEYFMLSIDFHTSFPMNFNFLRN